MTLGQFKDSLERFPVIATVHAPELKKALVSPAEILCHMRAELLTIEQDAKKVHEEGKYLLVNIDLAEGIAGDKNGLQYLANIGVDGIVSTRGKLIKMANEIGLITVQRFFALDSQGLDSIRDVAGGADLLEIMPGVVPKIISRFADGGATVIAGGLIETKDEVLTAINAGATAVSTGKVALWEI